MFIPKAFNDGFTLCSAGNKGVAPACADLRVAFIIAAINSAIAACERIGVDSRYYSFSLMMSLMLLA